jgi:hypothetical protein
VCAQGITALSLVSPTDIWAVGNRGLVLHYDGQHWMRQPNPTDPTGASGPNFTALAMVSATEGWALDQSNTLWHYHNSAWSSLAKAPPVPGISDPSGMQLESITMISADEGWAVGQVVPQIVTTSGTSTTSTPGPPTGIIFHYSGGRWTLQYALPNSVIHAVSMTSASDGWAAAESDQQVTTTVYGGTPDTYEVATPLLLHYQTDTWHTAGDPVTDPDFKRGSLTQIAMLSSGDGWALETATGSVTYDANSASVGNVLLRYHNGAWSEVQLPPVHGRDSVALQALAVSPGGDVWLVGSAWWPREDWVTTPQNGTVPKATALILQYQNGKWVIAAS